jgi:hypothetical protein
VAVLAAGHASKHYGFFRAGCTIILQPVGQPGSNQQRDAPRFFQRDEPHPSVHQLEVLQVRMKDLNIEASTPYIVSVL